MLLWFTKGNTRGICNRESLLKRTGDGNQAKYSLPEYLECVKDEEIDNLLFDL